MKARILINLILLYYVKSKHVTEVSSSAVTVVKTMVALCMQFTKHLFSAKTITSFSCHLDFYTPLSLEFIINNHRPPI
jgi:hypothetical protein